MMDETPGTREPRTTCLDVEPRLSAFLDGETDPGETARIAGHLGLCDRCREVADELTALSGALLETPGLLAESDGDASEPATRPALVGVASHPRGARFRWLARTLLPLAAAACVLLALSPERVRESAPRPDERPLALTASSPASSVDSDPFDVLFDLSIGIDDSELDAPIFEL